MPAGTCKEIYMWLNYEFVVMHFLSSVFLIYLLILIINFYLCLAKLADQWLQIDITCLFVSSVCRILNAQLGETSRLAWLGVEANPLLESENLLKAYNRPSDAVESSSSKWFISKNAIISGLGLLGLKQGSGEPEGTPPKTRRKRIIRKKVNAGSP